MKLEKKHLSPYLPYKLKMSNHAVYDRMPFELVGISNKTTIVLYGDWSGGTHHTYGNSQYGITSWEPILRPLSDLTKPIEHNGEKFFPNDALYDRFSYLYNGNSGEFSEYLIENLIDSDDYSDLPYGIIEKLFEWHFDVFKLIDNGLAIDKNTLE